MTREKVFNFDDWEEFEKQQKYHEEQSLWLDTVDIRPVEWLWPGFIPRGMVTLLTGEEGLGKSQLALKIAAEFSKKEEWGGINPKDNAPGGLVKLYSAEDPLHQVLTPRVKANGATMSHVLAEGINIQTFLPDGIDDIARGIYELGISLVIIDPIIAYIGAKSDSNAAQDVRYIMRKLADLAEQSDTVIIGVMHPKKGEEQNAIHKLIGGSSAFGQAARSVLGVARHPTEPDQRVVGRIKGNLDRPPTPYVWEIVGTTVKGGKNEDVKTSKVRFIGEVDDDFDFIAAIMGRPQPHSDDGDDVSSALGEAIQFLTEELEEGPVLSTEIQAHRRSLGISERTMRRAKLALDVLSEKRTIDGVLKWFWALPEREEES